jgi:DNA-binding transcriptional ArsR family regulator
MSNDSGQGGPGSDRDPGAAAEGAAWRAPMSVDAASLKALAHPLRVRMYDLLGDHGPSTASQLAARLGESSGTTSYHLRLLAKHGFIEEDPDLGNKRDRYWRAKGYNLESAAMADDPEAMADLRVAANELWRTYARQIETWFRSAEAWGQTWRSASVSNLNRFEATPEEMVELRDEVMAVVVRTVERFRDREPPEGSVRVASQFHLFPLGTPEENPPKGS